jgi:hypothetical protein
VTGSGRSMAIECPHVYLPAALGHHLSGIFPGLFTRKDSDRNAPTQNVYIVKSVSLLNNLLEFNFLKQEV